ncbi:MAG: class I mannose-6-phosphate isomerase [Bacteroidales bacterium]|nr:class I mannose-6-phosphate isomerase [Bacteroidales bacterium]MBR4774070.1 class I mannose-6-phosphate isomerase [Bacteroidales bacterium]
MPSALYPLKFLPLYKNVIWGGNRLRDYGFNYDPLPNCGELWALSSVKDHESVIANGFLAENTLNEAIEIYMGDLVGDKIFNRYGTEFPLLVKLIDAAKDLSIQVHPDDELAQQRGMPQGKTEMWYVMQADPEARLISGFRRDTTPEEYTAALNSGHLTDLLHAEQPEPGDVYFIPAGRVHALGAGIMVAEIQQTSDCTYRIYDYDRVDKDGKKRQLHTAEAMDAIDFSGIGGHAHTHYHAHLNETTTLEDCPYFTTRLIPFDTPIRKNLEEVDTFVLYLCVEGLAAVKSMETIVPMHVGECVLVPAVADSVELFCEGPAKLLEVTIDTSGWDDAPSAENDWVAQFIGNLRDEHEHEHHCGCDCHHDH